MTRLPRAVPDLRTPTTCAHPVPHRTDRGASGVEYGLLVAAIAAVVFAVALGVGALVRNAIAHGDTCLRDHTCATPAASSSP